MTYTGVVAIQVLDETSKSVSKSSIFVLSVLCWVLEYYYETSEFNLNSQLTIIIIRSANVPLGMSINGDSQVSNCLTHPVYSIIT